MRRVIIYGDIHGCLDEWRKLRQKIGAGANDCEISVGDLFSKGPKPLETLRYARGEGVITIIGNHEDKALEIASAKKLGEPIESRSHLEFFGKTSANDTAYLFASPRFLKIANLTIVHAGLTNSVRLDRLSDDQFSILSRLRYVGAGAMDYRFWSELYNGNQGFVVYGHTPCDIRRDKHALGIDTGCVYGGRLSAAIFERRGKRFDTDAVEIEQVEARERYA
ncbi:MAG: metallophosphoesterase [Helicobacteraceae bacterium]|jgi:diadenosine tetraphosphatase ApaH/serine/threonine PP2A family protein phosphatase|nr:metallophosphoesterase [Helicobacteraceae bacterium]